MTDQSIFGRFQANDVPYVAFRDDNEDPEEEFSESLVLRPTPSTSSRTAPSTFQNFTTNRQQRYQHLPEDDEIEEDSDQESNEAPASLIVEMPQQRSKKTHPSPRPGMNIRELTMWKWVNVENLDLFFEQVYAYYVGKGFYCILLSRFLNLLTLGFIISFSTFLLECVDYSLIKHNNTLSNVIIPHCLSRFSGWSMLFITLFSIAWVWQAVRLVLDIRRLTDMFNFYTYLLNIPDVDIQTIPWQKVVNRIIELRENNPTTSHQGPNNKPQQRLDAHNITNRIMRQENYLIALFNKDMLDLTIPIPFFRQKNFLTKTLEWNLRYCIINHVFNDQGQVRRHFVKDTRGVQRERLTQGLRRRFIFMGILNIIFAPFIVVYLLIYFFFRYFEEYRNNPKNIGLRQWSPFARWKFREFNELPHLFDQRLNKSYKQANKYIDQFPREKTTLLAKFISFIASSLTAVLLLASIIDSEVFLGFEISPGRTVFFYLGILVPIVAISRGMSVEDHVVFDPTVRLKKVVEHTHYSPDNWKGKLDTDDQIIDFFREFTVHVDGLGYVCSFAVFDFKRHGNVKYGAPAEVENEYYLSKDGKMEKSFLNFKANHPDWEPTDPAGSLYLSRLNFSNQVHSERHERHERHNSIRSAHIDSILKNNRRSTNNVHFGYAPNYNYAGNTATGAGINSTIDDRPSSYVHNNTSRNSYRVSDQSTSDVQSSPDSSQEEHYASDLSGSFFLPGTKYGGVAHLSESNEPDRPRHDGVIGLLNQFYELNNSSM